MWRDVIQRRNTLSALATSDRVKLNKHHSSNMGIPAAL